MAEETVMPYTLTRVTRTSEHGEIDSLLDLAREVIREHHKDLEGADVAYLLRSGKGKEWWGMARRASEESWLLSGGVDLSVQVNGLLWGSRLLTTAGRKFLLDFLLSRFAAKTEGKTHMEVAEGEERQLYTMERQDLLSLAALIARHPQGHAELAEVAAIRKAIEEPAQYLLDLQAGDEEEDEDDDDEEPANNVDADPVYYYKARFVDLGDGQKKVTFRYSGAKMDPSELDGVHVHADQERKPGLPAMVAASSLIYDTSDETVHAHQLWLEDELEDNRRAAVARSKGAGLATLRGDLPPDETVGSELEWEAAPDPDAIDDPEDELPAEPPVEVPGSKRRGLRVAG